jgi:hypothetical protein
MEGLFEDVYELRLQRLARYSEFLLDQGGRDAVRRELRQQLKTASEVATRRSSGRVTACVLLWSKPSILGLEELECLIEAPPDGASLEWVRDRMRDLSPQFRASFSCIVDPCHRDLLPKLAKLGLGAQALVLHGTPSKALRGLTEAGKQAPDIANLGLIVEPLRSEAQVDQCIDLRRRYFTANPRHSPINPNWILDDSQQAQIDEFVRSSLIKSIGREPPTQFVVLDDQVVRGGFGIDVDEVNPLLGCCAGVGIALDEAVQGRGIGRLAYQLLLERMIEMGVRVFKGTTANPAVIALAHRMRRPLRGTKVVPRKGAATREPFDYRVL